MTADRYEDVEQLSTEAVRELLANGSPPERVWAVWTLALRTAATELTGVLGREPDPGVRRTLAVILASHGEYDLLIALARSDPSALVRASAIQVVTRVAAGGAIPAAVVREAARRDATTRIAILGAISEGSPPFLIELAGELLSDDDLAVRLEAVEALVRVATPASIERAAELLATTHQLDVFLDAAGRWIRIAGATSCARAVAGASARLRGALLRQVRDPSWVAAAHLIGDDDELLAYAFTRSDIAVPARVLARAILRGKHVGVVERLTTQLVAAAGARRLLATVRRSIDASPGPDAAARHELLASARRCAVALEVPDATEVLAELARAHPVEQLLGIEHAVARWAATGALSELGELLRELRDYCTTFRAAARDPRHADQLALGDGDDDDDDLVDARHWNGRAHFGGLAKALDQLLAI